MHGYSESEGALSADAEIAPFIERHEQLMAEARDCFNTDTYEAFLELPKKLDALLAAYNVEIGRDDVRLPVGILEAVITQETIQTMEAQYRNMPPERGLYLPAGESGGDWWRMEDSLGEVGGMKRTESNDAAIVFLDAQGHGSVATAGKILMARFIELYHLQPEENISAWEFQKALDDFISECPLTYKSAEYAKASVVRSGTSMTVDIEKAGGPTVFIRNRKTGAVTLVEEGNGVLGYGMLKMIGPSAGTRIELDEPCDVFLASDGLLDILTGSDENQQFGAVFEEFCSENNGLTPDEFRDLLFAYAGKAKKEGRALDDITILVLPIASEPAHH